MSIFIIVWVFLSNQTVIICFVFRVPLNLNVIVARHIDGKAYYIPHEYVPNIEFCVHTRLA